MRFIGRSGGAAPTSNIGWASGCTFPRKVTTWLSLMGLVIIGRGCICCAPARAKPIRNTLRAENREREEIDTSIPLEQRPLMYVRNAGIRGAGGEEIQQLWLCREYCSFNDLRVK